MKSCVNSAKREISVFWQPRQISDLTYCESKNVIVHIGDLAI